MAIARYLCETIGALYQLARLGFITRFSFKGPYWTWRMHTAFGPWSTGKGPPGSRLEAVKGVLDYGRWVHRMRRGV